MRKILILLISTFISQAIYGLEIRTGEKITISQPLYGDLYIAGGTVIIDAQIFGDLVVAGGTVTINGTVENDITIIGGEVTINGTAKDDVRGLGGEIKVNGIVEGDLVITGGQIAISHISVINGSAAIASGGLVMDGRVKGDLKFAGGDITLNGIVEGDINNRADKINISGIVNGNSKIAARDIDIDSEASFYNNVQYWSNTKPDFKESIKKGNAVYDPSMKMNTNKWQYLGFATVLGVLWYIAVVYLFILLTQYLFSNTMKNAAEEVFNSTLRSLGVGLLFVMIIPVAVFILFISIIGIPIGIIVLIAYIILILLATIISSVVAANWLNKRGNHNWNTWRLSAISLLLFIAMKFISMIPAFGWFIMAIIACMVFGAIISAVSSRRERRIIMVT